MGFMTRLFLESPLWLGIFSFLLFAAVLLARTRWESATARRYALPLVLSLIALLFLLQKLIVTQREEVLDSLNRFVRSIEQENLSEAGGFISLTYQVGDIDRDGFLARLESFLNTWNIRDARILWCELELAGSQAEMTLRANATASRQGEIGDSHWGVWRIDWERDSSEWRINSIQTESIDGIKATTLQGRIP